MKAGITIGAILVATAVTVAAIRIGFAHRIADGTGSSRSRCRANLMALDGFKHTWASEHHKSTNDARSSAEVYESMGSRPVCPEGGTYTIGRVGELPTCSLPQHRSLLPVIPNYE